MAIAALWVGDHRPAPGGPRLALADRPGGPDADRWRRHPVLAGLDGRAVALAEGGTAPALERPLGVWIPRRRREPDGGLLPPHWLLYGLLDPEVAYAWSLVFHTLWGSLGAYWAARQFGASEIGSALAGFAWSTCGFFLIHLSHQWGYTTGSWMPWAWGLAWVILGGGASGSRHAPFWLAIVLCVQLLPGHFQLAFCTEVGVAILVLEQAGERLWTRSGGFVAILGVRGLFQSRREDPSPCPLPMGEGSPQSPLPPGEGGRRPGEGSARESRRELQTAPLRVLAALATAFVLAAMQLWPTLRLARLASSQRDF